MHNAYGLCRKKEKPIWTAGRIKAFITSVLRSGYRKWPPKYTVLNEAKVGKKKNKKTNRIAQHYKCAKCKKEFPLSDIQVDHIEPVVDPTTGFTNWDDFITRLFCDESNLQVLCVTCHNKKTDSERKKKANLVSKEKGK